MACRFPSHPKLQLGPCPGAQDKDLSAAVIGLGQVGTCPTGKKKKGVGECVCEDVGLVHSGMWMLQLSWADTAQTDWLCPRRACGRYNPQGRPGSLDSDNLSPRSRSWSGTMAPLPAGTGGRQWSTFKGINHFSSQ